MLLLGANNTASSSQFTYDPTTRVLACEASDLKDVLISSVFSDVSGIGFIIKSDKTGKELIVSLTKTVLDDEREISHYVFKPLQGNGERWADASCIAEVHIFND